MRGELRAGLSGKRAAFLSFTAQHYQSQRHPSDRAIAKKSRHVYLRRHACFFLRLGDQGLGDHGDNARAIRPDRLLQKCAKNSEQHLFQANAPTPSDSRAAQDFCCCSGMLPHGASRGLPLDTSAALHREGLTRARKVLEGYVYFSAGLIFHAPCAILAKRYKSIGNDLRRLYERAERSFF